MVFVMVVVFAVFLAVLIRFRRKKGDESIPKQVAGNHKLEILWTIIPIVLLILTESRHQKNPHPPRLQLPAREDNRCLPES